jgi:hypothetical protein
LFEGELGLFDGLARFDDAGLLLFEGEEVFELGGC